MTKYFAFILTLLILTSCLQKSSDISKCDCEELTLVENLNTWMLNNKPYTGDCETFYNNGVRESFSTFKNGKIHGTLISYYKNGKIEESVEYINSMPHGKVVYYFQNGDTSEFGVVENDKKNGEWIGYYENGNLMYKHNWQNDLLKDSAFDYFEDGTVKMKGFFVQGKADGIWSFYDSLTGKIDGFIEYQNDSVIRKFN